jgi:hypothetical protein
MVEPRSLFVNFWALFDSVFQSLTSLSAIRCSKTLRLQSWLVIQSAAKNPEKKPKTGTHSLRVDLTVLTRLFGLLRVTTLVSPLSEHREHSEKSGQDCWGCSSISENLSFDLGCASTGALRRVYCLKESCLGATLPPITRASVVSFRHPRAVPSAR